MRCRRIPSGWRWRASGAWRKRGALVERALAAWSAVGTADIRWGIRHPEEEEEAEPAVKFEKLGNTAPAAAAVLDIRRDPDGVSHIYSCGVDLNEGA